MYKMKGICLYMLWGLSLLILPFSGTPDLSAREAPDTSNAVIASGMGGGKQRSGGGRSGGGRSRSGGSKSFGGGKKSFGGGKKSFGGGRSPGRTYHPPGRTYHPPHGPYINRYYPPQYTPPPVIYSQPQQPQYPPPSYSEPTPPPTYYTPPPVVPEEEPPPEVITIVIVIYINDVPIPIDVPIDVIDDGTVIEIPADDGTVIYVIPCNEASPPGESPTGGTGFWQWIPPSAGQICGYWVWIPTDEAGTPITIIDVYPPGMEPPTDTTIIDVFPPVDQPTDTTIIDVFPPFDAGISSVIIILGDGTILEIPVTIDIIDGSIIIDVVVDGGIIYIIPGNVDNPPLVGPIDELGYWQWVVGYDGYLGYWLWIPVDAYGNPSQLIIDLLAPPCVCVVTTQEGVNTVVLPGGAVITVLGGDGNPAVVTVTYGDGTSNSVTVPVAQQSSVINIPLKTGITAELSLFKQDSPPVAAPVDSPNGHWEWVAAKAKSKGYWIWVPDAQKQPRKVDMSQKKQGHLEKVPAKSGQKSHMKWVPGKADQKQKFDQKQKPVMDKTQNPAMTQQKKPVVDQKQKMKGRTELMRGKPDPQKSSKGHLKWVPSGQSDQQQPRGTR